MQVQKPEIRQRILDVALQLFFENGFEGTSTRTIAREVNISVSNLYKYFEDKNAIFTAVAGPFYQFVKDDLDKLFGAEHSSSDAADPDDAFSSIMNMMRKDRYRFVVLVNRSRGTEFEFIKDEIIDMTEQHINESMASDVLIDKAVIRLIAGNLIEGLLVLAEKFHDSMPALEDGISVLIRYHMAGIDQFLNKEKGIYDET